MQAWLQLSPGTPRRMRRTGLIVALALAGLGAAPAGAAVNFGDSGVHAWDALRRG